ALQMPWMRFREPQSLTAAMTRLEAAIVGDTLRLGEAKAIWGRWRLLFFLVPPLKAAESTEWKLGQLSLERSLVVHRSREKLNGSAVLPYLGGDGVTPLKQQYLEALEQLHPVTGDPSTTPSVWAQTKLFGSQLWPDTTADSTPTVETPFVTPAMGNRGCVSCSELLEFFRTGNPSWVWDLALPQSDLLLYSAWYNTDRRPSRYNGFYVGDGTGEGDWHRPSVAPVGATTHNLGIKLAYVLRPSPMVLDRFVAAADAFRLRYDKPREKQNERGPDQRIELASLDGTPSGEILFEHLEMLQNCAEFVPGALGDACLTTVDAVYDELVEENIVAHTACAGDPAPVANCSARSYAMLARIGARVIYRYVTALRPNTATSLALRQMLVESARQLTDVLLPKLTTKNALDLDADWFAAMECTRNGDALESCTTSSDPSDKVDPAWRPALLSLVFIASQLDPTFDRCELMLNTFADLNMYAGWLATLATTPGWDAYSAGMLDAAIFSVGGLDRCQESQ
ncbi:MAG: hypothetical protein KC609_06845, partial [Myxococcales bacterium]|nr:hypothetical protein [Myxococcales bacterium]